MWSGSELPPVFEHARTISKGGGPQTIHKYWIKYFLKNPKICLFFFCHTVMVRLAGPWHGCPPFPLHSKAMVTCSGWFLYSRGRLSSNSCSVATCWASRATAILKIKSFYYSTRRKTTLETYMSVCAQPLILFDDCSFMYLACSCKMLRSCCTSSAAALGSVRQVVGTSATGGFGVCSSGAGWGTGCFCRLDRMRSLAAKPSTQSPKLKGVKQRNQ